jgi:hypothetical protein
MRHTSRKLIMLSKKLRLLLPAILLMFTATACVDTPNKIDTPTPNGTIEKPAVDPTTPDVNPTTPDVSPEVDPTTPDDTKGSINDVLNDPNKALDDAKSGVKDKVDGLQEDGTKKLDELKDKTLGTDKDKMEDGMDDKSTVDEKTPEVDPSY